MANAERKLVDVRQPSEYARGHIRGSDLIPLGRLARESGQWDKQHPLTLVCRSGHRAEIARRQLASMGFQDLAVLSGGVERWRADGNPLVVSEQAEASGVRWRWMVGGPVILASLVLAYFVSPWFLVVVGIVAGRLIATR